jgi:hypothetical protein
MLLRLRQRRCWRGVAVGLRWFGSKKQVIDATLPTFTVATAGITRVLVVEELDEVQAALSALLDPSGQSDAPLRGNSTVLGFDTEWPSSWEGSERPPVTVVQLSSADTVVLFRLNRLLRSRVSDTDWPAPLVDLLCSQSVCPQCRLAVTLLATLRVTTAGSACDV